MHPQGVHKVIICLPDRALHHPTNAQLGMAIMRAGVTHWHAGQIEVGHELICKAYGILLITHGPNHPITQDLEVREGVIDLVAEDL
jgi:hypothetical protein